MSDLDQLAAGHACANCGGAIGALETPYAWHEYIVCSACYQRLAQPQATAGPPSDGDTIDMGHAVTQPLAYQPAPQSPVFAHARGPCIVCPNPRCGYQGRSIRRRGGSRFISFLFFLLAIIPGLFYVAIFRRYQIICPKCGMKIRDD